MADTIMVERTDDIATVILNRPQKLNAFTKDMWKLLGEILDGLSSDTEVHCIVLRGAGDRAFSAGADIHEQKAAADELSLAGINCEVIDLRVLRPLDTETILDSVRKTHRAVVVDEAWRTGSLAGEISAQIAESAFFDLDAPVARVCSAEVPMPYAKHLEQAALPQRDDIVAAVRTTMGGQP